MFAKISDPLVDSLERARRPGHAMPRSEGWAPQHGSNPRWTAIARACRQTSGGFHRRFGSAGAAGAALFGPNLSLNRLNHNSWDSLRGHPFLRRAAALFDQKQQEEGGNSGKLQVIFSGLGARQPFFRLRQTHRTAGPHITPQAFHVHVNHRSNVERQELRND